MENEVGSFNVGGSDGEIYVPDMTGTEPTVELLGKDEALDGEDFNPGGLEQAGEADLLGGLHQRAGGVGDCGRPDLLHHFGGARRGERGRDLMCEAGGDAVSFGQGGEFFPVEAAGRRWHGGTIQRAAEQREQPGELR